MNAKIFLKIQEDFNKGLIDKKTFISKIEELRTKQQKNNLKSDSQILRNSIKSSYEDLIIEEPIDNSYLLYLLDKVSHNNIKGLINVINDNCYNINNIGLKINIVKMLIDAKSINMIKVKNDYIKKEYAVVNFKNNNIKFFNKLYLINNIVFVSYLNHDSINTIAYGENLCFEDVHNPTINKNIILNHVDFKKDNYTYVDKELKAYQFIVDLINVLKHFNNDYNKLTIDISDIEDNLFNYLHIINTNEITYYKYDKLYYKFKYVEQYFKQLDSFKSNDLNIKTTIEDYSIDNYLKGINYICGKTTNIKIDKKRRTSIKGGYNLL